MTVAQKQLEKTENRGRQPKKEEESSGFNQMMNKKVKYNSGKAIVLKRKRAMEGDLYYNLEVKYTVMERAKEVQANISSEFPSMIKFMRPSHVTGGFWLGLSKHFCSNHLPKQDKMIILEDESGEKFETKFLVDKSGLSGGWRGFSMAHRLVEGDVLIFHLVEPCKFKVYVVRSNGTDEVDGAIGLLKLDAFNRDIDFVKDIGIHVKEVKSWKLENVSAEKVGKDSLMFDETELIPKLEHPETQSNNLKPEVLDGIRLSDSVVEFKQVKNLDDFSIRVNGLIINSVFSKHFLDKYYELCHSQKSFLHDHLLEGLNCELITGIITETINIADAIRASKLTTFQDHFLIWEKTLKAFGDLGMNVGFLNSRLGKLLQLALKWKRYKAARLEWDQAKEEKRVMEVKIAELNMTMNRLDMEIKSLARNNDEFELEFLGVAKAPW